jgi:hypothetical protein
MFTLLNLKLLLVQASQVLNLLVTLQLNLILLDLDLTAQAIVIGFLFANRFFKLIDLVLIGLKFIFILLLVSILVHLDVILVALNLGLEIITTLFLDQNFLRKLDRRQLCSIFLFWLLIRNEEHSNHTVLTNREQLCVVEAELEASDGA